MLCRKRYSGYVLAISVAALALGCGMTELLQRTPTATEPSPETVSGGSPTLTPTDRPTGTAEPGTSPATPTPEPPPQPTPTDKPAATDTPGIQTPTPTPSPEPTRTATPGPTETLPGLRIESFDVEVEDTGDSKVIRCTWDTSGATGVQLVVGTSQRFPPWYKGDPDGSTVFELASTVYDRPEVTLTAYGEGGGEAIESITLDWPCDMTYFFADSNIDVPRNCPHDQPATRQGAQQPFQGGSAIWIPGIEGADVIYILYNDTSWDRLEDTWDESQPESDPSIVPPTGLLQPIRGFGKVWRENARVQSGLSWATAHEAAVPVTYQRQRQESLGGVVYIRVADGAVVRLTGLGGSGSTWTTLP